MRVVHLGIKQIKKKYPKKKKTDEGNQEEEKPMDNKPVTQDELNHAISSISPQMNSESTRSVRNVGASRDHLLHNQVQGFAHFHGTRSPFVIQTDLHPNVPRS